MDKHELFFRLIALGALTAQLTGCGSHETANETSNGTAEDGATGSSESSSNGTSGDGDVEVSGSSGDANTSSSGGANTSGTTGGSSAGSTGSSGSTTGGATTTTKFSFFVTSWARMQELSGSQAGFGGDLRFGETGDGAGLRGADKICSTIAEKSLKGAGSKQWRAFLSATKGEDGQVVNAIDRVGEGPWYDRLGRLVAMTKTDLINQRPSGADAAIINDLPNEDGVPNHNPDGLGEVDNHDILTGTNDKGQLFNTNPGYTCNDWTSSVGSTGTPRVGHSWPRNGGPSGGGTRPGGGGSFGDPANWMSALNEAGCAAGASLIEMGPPNPANPTVGSGGGYGGIYCFALTP